MDLQQRVELMEHQNRRLKTIGLGLLLLFGLICIRQAIIGPPLAFGQNTDGKADSKPVRKLEIADQSGKVRIRLGTEPITGIPTLEFLDEDGNTRRARLNQFTFDFFSKTDKTNPEAEFAPGQLLFRDETGTMRILLSFAKADGKTQAAGLRLFGPGGSCGVESKDDTGPQILLSAPEQQNTSLFIGARRQQGYIAIYDNTRPVFQAGSNPLK